VYKNNDFTITTTFFSVFIKSSKIVQNNKTNLGFNENIKLPNVDKVQFTYTAVYIIIIIIKGQPIIQ